MPETMPESVEPYTNISSKAYEHPADRAATAALKAIPMLDTVVRKLIEWRYERALRQRYLSNSVRVGERQLPELWSNHTAVCKILDMPDTYDLYVTDTVVANAVTIGSRSQSSCSDPRCSRASAPASREPSWPTRSRTSCPTTCSTRRRSTSC
jgi:hypothetical protein